MRLAMTLPLARRSPLYLPRRDLVLDAGDGLTLDLDLVASDTPGAAPLDLVGIGPRVRLSIWYAVQWTDYGMVPSNRATLWTGDAVVSASTPGRATVTIPRGIGAGWGQRCGWTVQLDYLGEVSGLAWGALHLQSGASLVESVTDLLDDVFVPVTDETPAVIEV